MKVHRIFRAGAAAALLGALAGPGLSAQEASSPYSFALKTRVGLMAGDMRDTHFDNKVLGFGAEAKRDLKDILGIGGAVTAELTWEYIPGRFYENYPWGANPLNLDIKFSWDARKEYGQGFSVRAAYSAPFTLDVLPDFLPSLDFEWFAGLGFDRFKVRSHAEWIFDYNLATSHTPVAGQYDGGTVVEEGAALVPGVFAGLKYRVSKDFGLELSVRNFGMRTFTFTPGAYSNPYKGQTSLPTSWQVDFNQVGRNGLKTESGTTRGWSLEFALAAKL